MEMSPEWKAITKCESRIEALEKKLFENSGDPYIIKHHAEQIAELKEKYELNEKQYKIIYNSIHEVMVYKCESCLKKTIVEKIKGDEKKDGV